MKFVKRPVAVDAVKFLGGDYQLPAGVVVKEIPWTGPYADHLELKHGPCQGYFLKTQAGDVQISVGDWIVTDEDGNLRPCNSVVFVKLFVAAP